jgi:hypothetical protein
LPRHADRDSGFNRGGRELTAAINHYNQRVSELHADIRKIEQSVGFLCRAERYQRESNGHKVNF